MSAATRATLIANQSEAKFFAIPAEIRNRIYRLVLGKKSIHITSSGQRACYADQPDRETADSIIAEGKTIDLPTWQNKHIQCYRANWTPPVGGGVLNLLLVCRQIHSEACLMPFTEYSFVLRYFSGLDHFAGRLIPEQRGAITHLSLLAYTNAFLYDVPKASTLRNLSGLRHLTIFHEIRGNVPTPHREKAIKELGAILKTVADKLRFVAWESVALYVTCNTARDVWRLGSDISANDFEGICAETEDTLLQFWDAQAELQKTHEARKARLDATSHASKKAKHRSEISGGQHGHLKFEEASGDE